MDVTEKVRRRKFHPTILLLHPEEFVIGNLVRAVCSECEEELQPYDFGGGTLHWTCGCEIDQY
jgi:hypothetical protein